MWEAERDLHYPCALAPLLFPVGVSGSESYLRYNVQVISETVFSERDFMDPGLCKNCTHFKAYEKSFAGIDLQLLSSHIDL